MNERTDAKGWPERPETWPANMDETEAALYLRIDDRHTPASAKRALRYLRRAHGLPSMGRICGRLLFNRDSIDRWIAAREQNDARIRSPSVESQDAADTALAETGVPHGSRKMVG